MVLAALCQVHSDHDLAANRRRAAEAVARAGEAGAALVVLPEAMQRAFLDLGEELVAAAEPLDGPFVAALVDAAGKVGATVIAGMFEAVAGAPKVHNTVVVVTGDGLVGRYRKLHLYDALGWAESAWIEPGDPVAEAPLAVSVQDHVVGVMTCYDLRFPEVARRLVDQGCTVLAVPAAWVPGPGKEEQWRVLLQARANENTCFVLGADQPSPGGIGLSMAVDPRGHVMVSLDPTCEQVALADLSSSTLGEARQALPLLQGRRFQVVPRR